MNEETQKTLDLIAENKDHTINFKTGLTIGKQMIDKYNCDPEALKAHCKKTRFLQEEGVKWSKVDWSAIGESL